MSARTWHRRGLVVAEHQGPLRLADRVGGVDRGEVAVKGTTWIRGVAAGGNELSLGDVEPGCTVAGGNPRTVAVPDMPLPRNMIVYRLGDGKLLLHSVVCLDEAGMKRLLALGDRLGKVARDLEVASELGGLFKSTDGGQNWKEISGLRGHGTGMQWTPGAGGMCLHTILLDKNDKNRIYVAISAAGAFRTDDGGNTWKPITKGLHSLYIPDPTAEIGHCVHRITMHPSNPDVLFMQKHWDVMRSDDRGDNWYEVSGNLPSDFGFPIAVHAHEPNTIYVVPIKSDSEHYPPEGKLRVYRSRNGGNEWEALTNGLPQENCYVNVLRDAMSVDSLDQCGVYFGTSAGDIYHTINGGETWSKLAAGLPPVLALATGAGRFARSGINAEVASTMRAARTAGAASPSAPVRRTARAPSRRPARRSPD